MIYTVVGQAFTIDSANNIFPFMSIKRYEGKTRESVETRMLAHLHDVKPFAEKYTVRAFINENIEVE